jgi:hypothetical protein
VASCSAFVRRLVRLLRKNFLQKFLAMFLARRIPAGRLQRFAVKEVE